MKQFIWEREAVLTCSVAPGQHLPHSAQPIIWHLVCLDRDLCGNNMFQQRLLICVMPVVWMEKTLISLWSPFSTKSALSDGRCELWKLWFCLRCFRIHGCLIRSYHCADLHSSNAFTPENVIFRGVVNTHTRLQLQAIYGMQQKTAVIKHLSEKIGLHTAKIWFPVLMVFVWGWRWLLSRCTVLF